jgi:hypothetical protein
MSYNNHTTQSKKANNHMTLRIIIIVYNGSRGDELWHMNCAYDRTKVFKNTQKSTWLRIISYIKYSVMTDPGILHSGGTTPHI